MNLNELRTLVDYHYWARDRLMQAVEQLTPEQLSLPIASSFPSVRDTLVHLWGAEVIWLGRWGGHSPTSCPPATTSPISRRSLAHGSEEEAGFARCSSVSARTASSERWNTACSIGKAYVQPFWQMLLHLVNHGSYHRGQVTTMLRQLGVQPPKQMDFSAFCRENTAARRRTIRRIVTRLLLHQVRSAPY
jgi:uncharacterized damage-inducible protein DinB